MKTRYHIVAHTEPGEFESMTDAILWALVNLRDWDGKVELSSDKKARESFRPSPAFS